MRRMVIVGLLVCLGVATAHAEGDPGKQAYVRYCGACHGPEGKGDGIAGTFMRAKPADLTQLAKQNGGTFPFMRVMETIDGRNTPRAHGEPQMPVWGEIFAEEPTWEMARRSETRAKLAAITDYIKSIQEK